LNFVIGLIVALGCMLGGFAAMGGHLNVIWQPWEFVIIGGSALGTFIVANSVHVIKDTGKALLDALLGRSPKTRDYLDVLGVLHALMRELRAKGRNAVEGHVENPQESEIFKAFPKVIGNKELTTFICDYLRLIIIGNARPHEIEALMDEELQTIMRDKLKPYSALTSVADGLPALGIVAAVLGVIVTMGSITEPPKILGELIGAALVGTFFGVLVSYGFLAPIASAIKGVDEADAKYYQCMKAGLLAHMQGYPPAVSVEFARKVLLSTERPNFYEVEQAVSTLPPV
jgi:chemotaxis protein MotA